MWLFSVVRPIASVSGVNPQGCVKLLEMLFTFLILDKLIA